MLSESGFIGQVSLHKQGICLGKWLSVCLHKIYNTIQNKQTVQQCNGLRSLRKYVQGGMAIYSSCEMLCVCLGRGHLLFLRAWLIKGVPACGPLNPITLPHLCALSEKWLNLNETESEWEGVTGWFCWMWMGDKMSLSNNEGGTWERWVAHNPPRLFSLLRSALPKCFDQAI